MTNETEKTMQIVGVLVNKFSTDLTSLANRSYDLMRTGDVSNKTAGMSIIYALAVEMAVVCLKTIPGMPIADTCCEALAHAIKQVEKIAKRVP